MTLLFKTTRGYQRDYELLRDADIGCRVWMRPFESCPKREGSLRSTTIIRSEGVRNLSISYLSSSDRVYGSLIKQTIW